MPRRRSRCSRVRSSIWPRWTPPTSSRPAASGTSPTRADPQPRRCAVDSRRAAWSARRVLDAFRDLVLGGRCVGCERAGRLLCGACKAGLDVVPYPAWPTPVPPGLVAPWAATAYDGVVRAMVVGHKEHRLLALAGPLGDLLAQAVHAALADLRATPAPVLLVPVPPRPSSARRRGYEPTPALPRVAAARLASYGIEAGCVSPPRTRRGLADQAGLDAAGRAANLA